jgi:NADH-quinone oxidoreductase subunit A
MLFDVEVIFMWPWAVAFYRSATEGATVPLDDGTMVGKGFLLAGMGIFFLLLVFGLIYEWKKGAFQWD